MDPLRIWIPILAPVTVMAAAPAAESPGLSAVPVAVARVERMELAAGQSFVGTVFPARGSDVGSAVDGRVVSLPFLEGQRVAAGQPIAELLRGILEIERAGATAELDRRRQVLAELNAGSRPEEIDQRTAAVQGLEAQVQYAKSRLDRLRRLAERGTSTADELLDGETEFRRVEAELRSSRAVLELAEAGPRKEQIAQAAAAVAVQEAEVDRIEDQLGKHTIRSPFNGWVVQRFTEEGQWLSRGGLVARIVELDTVEIDVRVPEISVRSLSPGQDVRLEFDAAPGETWIGRVERIVPQADLLSRSFPVKVRLANRVVDEQPVLRGGMLARAWLPVGRSGMATVVPKDALVLGGAGPIVYVVTPEQNGPPGTVRAVPVAVGAAVEGAVEIRDGLEPGQIVVVRGNERLRPGMAVTFAEP